MFCAVRAAPAAARHEPTPQAGGPDLARRRCLGRPAKFHRRTARHPDRRSGAAAGRDASRAAPALRLAGRETRRPAQRRPGAAAARLYTSTTWSAGSSPRAAGARRPTCACAACSRTRRFEPPPALRRLAAITDFDLFVVTTFDPLLENAINLERFGGAPTTEVICLFAEPRGRPARRARPAAAPRASTTCSAASPPRRPTSSPTRTCWSSSAHCRASTWRRRSCSTSSSTTTCCSSAAISPTGWRACSCAWPSASAFPTRATSARCWPTTHRAG